MNLEQNKYERLLHLKKRAKHCVCRFCGNELTLKLISFSEVVDVRSELFCPYCKKIEYGVEKEIYESAKAFVDITNFNCYSDKSFNDITYRMTVGKICEIIQWHDSNIGILEDDGYNIALPDGSALYKDEVIMTNKDIESLK